MKILKYILLLIAAATVLNTAYAQTKEQKKAKKLAAVKEMVEGQRFNFIAQYATAQGGARKYLTSAYDLRIRKDSIIAYLPYFGRAYFDVPYNPTDGGIKFTSTNFTYKVTPKKKGGWDVIMEPADAKYYRRINMYITVDGNANVNFTITNKSYISFDGYIESADKNNS